jgi:DNA ligase D-like protein (predicted ligase)/DNA ligase D-like protein (predicted 3'-phosphoesterase)
MLAKSANMPFDSEEWIYEIKWDGIRALSYVNDDFSIRSRNDKELKHSFPELEELKTLTHNTVIDGEIIVMKNGKADFQTLSERSKAGSDRDIRYLSNKSPATYIIFDILEKDAQPLIHLPLIERKSLLKKYVTEGQHVLLSDYIEKQGKAYYETALAKGIEGIMAKNKQSPYEPGIKSSSWLKIKHTLSCDCVIFGYTEGQGARKSTFGALILGLYNNTVPTYVGKVGTGFSQETRTSLLRTFEPLRVSEKTLRTENIQDRITWLKPEIVCQVAYQNVTREGRLRMPRFRDLRNDKAATECTLDQIVLDKLEEYALRRNFNVSPEPMGTIQKTLEGQTFVIQEHHARALHHDLRLEKNGVLRSWAVPKGMPEKLSEKRLAVETEDHPIQYGAFEGTIPKGQYGAGTVKIIDHGTYELKAWSENLIEFKLEGRRYRGKYALTRFKKAGEKQWLLIKTKESK